MTFLYGVAMVKLLSHISIVLVLLFLPFVHLSGKRQKTNPFFEEDRVELRVIHGTNGQYIAAVVFVIATTVAVAYAAPKINYFREKFSLFLDFFEDEQES